MSIKQLLLSRRSGGSGALALQRALRLDMVVRSRTASPLDSPRPRGPAGDLPCRALSSRRFALESFLLHCEEGTHGTP
jgi:hypothetical protein